jgi:hypothetical protein
LPPAAKCQTHAVHPDDALTDPDAGVVARVDPRHAVLSPVPSVQPVPGAMRIAIPTADRAGAVILTS